MGRSLRPWWLALGASLLVHVALIGGGGWGLPVSTLPAEPQGLEARLVSVPPAPVVSRTQPKPVVTPPRSAGKPHPPARQPQPPRNETAEPLVAAAPVPDEPAAVLPVEHAVREEATAPVPQASAAPSLPPLNTLPARIDLRFEVRYGIASGEQTMVWVNEDGQHYTLISVAEATGLAGMLYRGKFVQTSRGRITPRGLQPEAFWDQRGDKRSSAVFDLDQGRLTLTPAQGAPRHFQYQGEVQDVLSLFFHLALTAPPPDGRLMYTVFNGKKLRDYAYDSKGESVIETALGAQRVLHLARVLDRDGRFEVWLAIDRHYLPVRVVRSDEKGNEFELRLLSMTP